MSTDVNKRIEEWLLSFDRGTRKLRLSDESHDRHVTIHIDGQPYDVVDIEGTDVAELRVHVRNDDDAVETRMRMRAISDEYSRRLDEARQRVEGDLAQQAHDKAELKWKLEVAARAGILAYLVGSLATRKDASPTTLRRASNVLEYLTAFVPKRVADEEIGDALESIHRNANLGRRYVWIKVVSTIVWVVVNAVREMASAILGKKRGGA